MTGGARRSLRRWTRVLMACCVAGGLLLCIRPCVTHALFSDWTGTSTTRELSPYGNCDVVRESRSSFLDTYTKLWISHPGDLDRNNWRLIGPEVDGGYFVDWVGPDHLLLTNYGWPRMDRAHEVLRFGSIRVEIRPPGVTSGGDSPDGMYSFTTWTFEDSRGTRSTAHLSASWQNPERGSVVLLDEGPWQIRGSWLQNNQLRLHVDPASAAAKIPRRFLAVDILVQ